MHQLKYKITALEPIIISARYGDTNMVGTLQHIPGTSVLGMIAWRFLSEKKIFSSDACSDVRFHSNFFRENLIFQNAYICLTDEYDEKYIHFPTPITIHREKTGSRVYDLLLTDKEQTKSIGGFCHIKENDIKFGEVETTLNFHHARNPETGTSEEGMIFNYESVCKDQTFQGVIKGRPESLKDIVSICSPEWTGYIGRSRNSQYGKVLFELIDKEPLPVADEPISGNEVSLTLISDTIIYNENGFSTTDVRKLEAYLGLKIKKAFIRQDDVETFVSTWRLRKASETCFRAGSCFLLEISGETDRKHLSGFRKTGIGERKNEGFGHCIVNWQTEDILNERQLKMPGLKEPGTKIPQVTKEIFKTLIKNAIKKEVVRSGLIIADNIKTPPSNSLISRLNAMICKSGREEFIESVKKLRPAAKKQLESCFINGKTLLDFLTDKTSYTEEVFNKPAVIDIQELCKKIEYSPTKDTVFEVELYRKYLTSFFSAVRMKTDKSTGGAAC